MRSCVRILSFSMKFEVHPHHSTCLQGLPPNFWIVLCVGHTTLCLSAHQLMNIWVMSTLGCDQQCAMNIYAYPGADLGADIGFQVFWMFAQECDGWITWWLMLKLLRNSQVIFQGYCDMLHSHQKPRRVPIPPYPHQHFLLSTIDFSHPRGWNIFSAGFNLHFPSK